MKYLAILLFVTFVANKFELANSQRMVALYTNDGYKCKKKNLININKMYNINTILIFLYIL